jgi:zinc/manganese transport system permease protein
VAKTAAIYAAIGALHFAFRRPFGEITRDAEAARVAGRRVALWDFAFYATFGVVITSSVQIAGVLLVFTFLIAPAILGRLIAERFATRLALGWSIGAAVSFVGLLASWDRPSGPTIVTLFGLLLAAVGIAVWIRSQARPARAALVVAAAAAGLVALWLGTLALFPADHAHASETEATGVVAEPAPDPLAELGAAELLDDEMLVRALEDSTSEADRLRYATVLHRRGDARGTAVLRALAHSARSVAVRRAARERSEE